MVVMADKCLKGAIGCPRAYLYRCHRRDDRCASGKRGFWMKLSRHVRGVLVSSAVALATLMMTIAPAHARGAAVATGRSARDLRPGARGRGSRMDPPLQRAVWSPSLETLDRPGWGTVRG